MQAHNHVVRNGFNARQKVIRQLKQCEEVGTKNESIIFLEVFNNWYTSNPQPGICIGNMSPGVGNH